MKITAYNQQHHLDLSGSVATTAYAISRATAALGSNTPRVLLGTGATGSGPQAAAWDHRHPAAGVFLDHGNAGATETIDVTAAEVHQLTLDQNVTLTISGAVASSGPDDVSMDILIRFVQDATGSRTVTWPAAVDFGTGNDQPDTAANSLTLFVLHTVDGGTTWQGFQVGGSSGGSVSYGSNSNRVAALSAAGASTLVSRADHVHDGIATVTASSSNTLNRGTLNLRAGTGIALALSNTDGGAGLDTVTIQNIAAPGGGGSVSYGSNSTRVSSVPAAGASTLVSRADHVHDGLRSIAKAGSAALLGDVTLTGGTNITLTQSGQDISIAAAGGGSGADANHPNPLDSYAIDGTYGDDFTGSSLGGLWTRRNFTSGAETYQVGPKGTYLRVSMSGRSNGDGYYQSAAGLPDGTYAAKIFVWGNVNNNFGIAIYDSSGTGVALSGIYSSPAAVLLMSVTTYTSYGGTFVSPLSSASMYGFIATPVAPLWLYIRKSGTSYFTSHSFNGETWAPESGSLTWAGTPNRMGFFLTPLGSIPSYVDIDWFNKIA